MIVKRKEALGFLLLFFCFSITAQTTLEKQKNWENFSENEFQIQYPKNWRLDSSKQFGTHFMLLSELTSKEDVFSENINLVMQNYERNLDFFVTLSKKQLKTMLTDSEILKNTRIPKNGTEYHKIIFTGKQGVFNLKFVQYYFIKNDKAYVLTFTSEANQFDNYIQVSQKIMNSFILN